MFEPVVVASVTLSGIVSLVSIAASIFAYRKYRNNGYHPYEKSEKE